MESVAVDTSLFRLRLQRGRAFRAIATAHDHLTGPP
jgi:hypothetical protein